MTFSLKNVHADEILEAMAETLGIDKVARTTYHSLQEYKNAVDAAAGDCAKLKNELNPDNARGIDTDAARGYWRPRMMAACIKGKRADDQPALDDDVLAANFALQHLVKVADVLDANGFEELAVLIDEDIAKITNINLLEGNND